MGMEGATVLVTGATGGIGLETARSLAREGAEVLLAGRNEALGRAAAEAIAKDGRRAEFVPMDLVSFRSVREAARRVLSSYQRLDVLVNNAGVVLRRRTVTPDGHETAWQTNFLSAFLLTNLLLSALRASGRARIVNVSSDAHRVGRLDWNDLEMERRRYSGFGMYANTKLALVLFTRELARREPSIVSTAVHPGAIATGIWRAAPKAMQWILGIVLPRPEIGARPVIRLASSPEAAAVNGRYFDRMREAEPAPAARSDADAARLWETAERATG
jgi:NAD(P)-dependent dehydrogenase (short-subunit alcohol dehydrogenase family)